VSCTAWPLSRKGQLLHKGSNIKKGQLSCRSARPSISLKKRKETRKTARLQRLNLCPSAGPVFADRPRPTSPSVLTNPGGQVVRASSFQLQRRSSYWRLGPQWQLQRSVGGPVHGRGRGQTGDTEGTWAHVPLYPRTPVPFHRSFHLPHPRTNHRPDSKFMPKSCWSPPSSKFPIDASRSSSSSSPSLHRIVSDIPPLPLTFDCLGNHNPPSLSSFFPALCALCVVL
jgi:hypothetical protein